MRWAPDNQMYAYRRLTQKAPMDSETPIPTPNVHINIVNTQPPCRDRSAVPTTGNPTSRDLRRAQILQRE
jgi:hypothetical protein